MQIFSLFCNAIRLGAILALSACATPLTQPHIEPKDAPHIEMDAFMPGNGIKLPMRAWIPDEEPRAIVIALHGFNDYSNAFNEPGNYFASKGVAMFAYDQRGFGATDSHGIWAGEANLVSDLKQMVLAVNKLYPGKPVYLLGESMGGAVVIVSLATPDFPKVQGAILSAPAVWGDETMNAFYRGTLWLLAHTVPSQSLTGRGLKIQASDNIPMLIALGRDPLVIKRTRVDAVYGIVKLMDHAYHKVDEIKTPMLMLYGAKDQIIPRPPVVHAIRSFKAPYSVAYYPEGYHMLLRDLKAKTVLDDVLSWVDNRYRILPSGYDWRWSEYLLN